MSIKPGVYGHAAGYRATPGELLAVARAQTAEWNAYSPEDSCGRGHKIRAIDQDGCTVFSRADLAMRLASGAYARPVESSAVIEFCLVCGTTVWLDDSLQPESEDAAIALAAPWTLGRTYQLSYELWDAPDGSELGSGEFTYRGLTDAGGTHRFDPVAGGSAIYLRRGEIAAVQLMPASDLASA